MSGERLLLDTNAIVSLLQGNASTLSLVRNAAWIGVSIISELEFRSLPGLSEHDRRCLQAFLAQVQVVGLTGAATELIERIVELRRTRSVKLPDAIMAATALVNDAALVTADARLAKLPGLRVLGF